MCGCAVWEWRERDVATEQPSTHSQELKTEALSIMALVCYGSYRK